MASKLYVLTAGAKGEASRVVTHRLKLTLTPIERATGEDQEISDAGKDE